MIRSAARIASGSPSITLGDSARCMVSRRAASSLIISGAASASQRAITAVIALWTLARFE